MKVESQMGMAKKNKAHNEKWLAHQTTPMANKHIDVVKHDNGILTHHIGRKRVLSAYGGLFY